MSGHDLSVCRYKATVKIQAILRRKLGIKRVAIMLKENAMLDADGGD